MANLQETTIQGSLISLRQENVTSSSKTLQLADRDRVVSCTNSSGISITIPADGTVNFPVGSVVFIARVGTGDVTLTAEGGVTVSRTGLLGANEELYVRKRASNNWIVIERPYNLTGSGGSLATSGSFRVHSYTSGTGTFTVQN